MGAGVIYIRVRADFTCYVVMSDYMRYAVMNGIPLKDLTKLWGRGRVSSSILDKTNDYRDLAIY